MRLDRLLKFVPEEKYKKLDKDVRDKLLDYRKLYYNVNRKEKKIKRMVRNLKDERELLQDMKQDLTSKNNFVDHLRKTFYFTCSVVSYQKGKQRYYNITISRKGDRSKNVSLGRENKIRQHLFEYYKDKSFLRKNKDWKSFLKIELNSGKSYEKILDIILDDPLNFKKYL